MDMNSRNQYSPTPISGTAPILSKFFTFTLLLHEKEGEAWNRFCAVVVRVPGYRSKGSGSIPLSLVSTSEDLIERKSRAPV
jgi:hypothetical protein